VQLFGRQGSRGRIAPGLGYGLAPWLELEMSPANAPGVDWAVAGVMYACKRAIFGLRGRAIAMKPKLNGKCGT